MINPKNKIIIDDELLFIINTLFYNPRQTPEEIKQVIISFIYSKLRPTNPDIEISDIEKTWMKLDAN